MFEQHLQNAVYPGVIMNPMMQAPEPKIRDIAVPGVNDVMCGRGGGTNNHIGNIRFRQLVNGHKLRYLAATKSEKPMVSREVVTIWRGLNPPGRFLMQEKTREENEATRWYDIGDKKAREKASQCLRERTPEVIPFVKKLDLQLKLQEEEEGGRHPNQNGQQSAAELSKELLREQQQAAITAHMALQAFIPPSVMRLSQEIQQPSLSASNVLSSGAPSMHHSVRSTSLPHVSSAPTLNTPKRVSSSISVEQQRKKLSQEIELLQQQQAQMEAELAAADAAKASNAATASNDIVHANAEYTSKEILDQLNVDVGIEPIHTYPENAVVETLTKEEYRKSVHDYFFSQSSGASSSGRSVSSTEKNSNAPAVILSSSKTTSESNAEKNEREMNHSFDRSDFMEETMSRGSWVRSVNTFDDVSMVSNSMLSPGSSVKHMLDNLEPLDITAENLLTGANLKHSDKSLGRGSLSTYESQMLENLMNPRDNEFGAIMPGIPGLQKIHENDSRLNSPNGMPPPHSRHRISTSHAAGHSASYHHTSGSRPPHMTGHRGISTTSMLSDLSDFSNKSRHRTEAHAKLKSDTSMFTDNMSDLSEAMGSLDMSTK